MTEFVDYKVDLTHKDGTRSTGYITHVDSRQISLGNAVQSTNPNQSLPSLQILSNTIADLKVIQLPALALKKQKKGKSHLNNGGPVNAVSSPVGPTVLDDAIVFARAPSTVSQCTTTNAQFQPNTSNTPKPTQEHPICTVTNEQDWGNDSDMQDIKSSTDFDFAANLAMFDKKTVFADFQKKDTIDPSQRLVGHNKIENSKKKYDNDEMVLDTSKSDNWDKIGNTNIKNVSLKLKNLVSGSKNIISSQENIAYNQNLKFMNQDNLSSIHLASPVQLLEIERLSTETFGMTAQLMAEVCATNLSQLIINKCLGGSVRLSNKKNHNLPPLVLLLIGSARCGSRAFATGRHLTNHGVRVLAFVINPNEQELDKDLLQQWKLFESSGGKVISNTVNSLLDILNHQLDTPVELIIDGLQGYDDHLEDIFYEDKDIQELQVLMKWLNIPQQRNKIMCLDIPSGIDGGSGTVADETYQIHCKWCISMGVPITGLLLAYKNGHLQPGDISHYLVDVGIPNKVYTSKSNLRKFDKFWYCAESKIAIELSTE
jgi:enhancer of mRNA-decapping protein 3